MPASEIALALFLLHGGALVAVDEPALPLRGARRQHLAHDGLKRRGGGLESLLAAAFDRFERDEWRRSTPRAQEFDAFRGSHREWLDDYALFRALHDRASGAPWSERRPTGKPARFWIRCKESLLGRDSLPQNAEARSERLRDCRVSPKEVD